jgi:hypothetical protein
MAESGRACYGRIWESLLQQNLGESVKAKSGRVCYGKICDSTYDSLGKFVITESGRSCKVSRDDCERRKKRQQED